VSERRLRILGAACGIAGPIALTLYFSAPALLAFPAGTVSNADLAAYTAGHASIFYLGAWLQATGAALSVIFFLTLVQLAGAARRLSGLVTIVASALLLAVVLVEGAFLMAVPGAAASDNTAAMRLAFDLSNGGFVRVFPLAPASATFVALGAALLGADVLHRSFGYLAIAIGAAFEIAGFAAIWSGAGLTAALILSIGQEFWILAAAIALALSARRPARVT
jgi:hypothetical protein